jgi:hypothetical protein
VSNNSDNIKPRSLSEQEAAFRSDPVKTTMHDSSEPSKENAGAEAFWRDPDGAFAKEADQVKSAFGD